MAQFPLPIPNDVFAAILQEIKDLYALHLSVAVPSRMDVYVQIPTELPPTAQKGCEPQSLASDQWRYWAIYVRIFFAGFFLFQYSSQLCFINSVKKYKFLKGVHRRFGFQIMYPGGVVYGTFFTMFYFLPAFNAFFPPTISG